MVWMQDVAHSDAEIVIFVDGEPPVAAPGPLVETRPFHTRLGVIHFALPPLVGVRRMALEATPFDDAMDRFALHEWCYRTGETVLALPGAKPPKEPARRGDSDSERRLSAPLLAPIARFYRKHSLVMKEVFAAAPELTDTRSARLLLELVLARGTDWIADEWVEGGLGPLFKKRYKRPLQWWERRPAK